MRDFRSLSWWTLGLICCLSTLAWLGASKNLPEQTEAAAQDGQEQSERDALVERGKYLTHHVAMCVMCHSPHRRDGSLVEQQLFQGYRIPTDSPFRDQTWATFAPNIAGLPGGRTEADVRDLLMSGSWPDGGSPRPPMPPFRLKARDATAVAAYLNSLDD